MAGTDIGNNQQKEQKKGLRRPKRRVKVRIDMTPMVDIAFLLLIFYMVTTVFARPLIMEISLPSKQDEQKPKPYAESKLLTMYVDENDYFFYKIGEDMGIPERVGFEKLALIIDEKNRDVDKLVMLLKLDQKASYSSMVRIIDEMQSVERAINSEIAHSRKANPQLVLDDYSIRFSLQDMTAWDEQELDIAAEEKNGKL